MFNKVFIIGNLTRDPELRYTASGIPVARFTVAVNRPKRKSETPESEESAGTDVDFINVVAWRRLAEICGEFLKKGRPVAIEGKLHMRTYEKDGEKRTMAEVVADTMQMLGRKPEEIPAPEMAEEVSEEVLEEEKKEEDKDKDEDKDREEAPF